MHELVNPPHMNLLLALTRLCDVVGRLHPHDSVHLHSEGLLNAQRHVPGKVILDDLVAGDMLRMIRDEIPKSLNR